MFLSGIAPVFSAAELEIFFCGGGGYPCISCFLNVGDGKRKGNKFCCLLKIIE